MTAGKNLLHVYTQKRLRTGNTVTGAFAVIYTVGLIALLGVISLCTTTVASACDYTCDYGYYNDYGYAPSYGYNDYNYVQYPSTYYQYNQNPGPRNTMADYYTNASSLQYPYLQYQYNQNPGPRNPMADYYANAAATRYPYLQYQYASNPTPRDPMADYYANAASASYPYSIYVPVGSNQASVLSKYSSATSYGNNSYPVPQNYGGYYGGQQTGGFILTSGY